MHLHHLGFVVRNAAQALRHFPAPQFGMLTPPIDDSLQRVVVQFFREVDADTTWEIVSPLGSIADSPLSARLKRGGGIDHVCYELAPGDRSIDDTIAHEVAHGAIVLCKPVMAAAFGRRVAFVFRRSGAVVEFVEPRLAGQVV